MYITGSTAALEASISTKAYKVYLILCQYANNSTRECFVSKRTIAEKAALSLSGVVRATRELVHEGLIAIVSRFRENGRQTSNRYTILDCPQLRMEDTQKPSSVKEQGKKVRLFPITPAAVQLPALACRIYSFLTSLAGRVRECSASRKTIADACGVTLSTVTKNLSLLCREGFLRRIRQTRWAKYGHHGTRANLFVLTSPCHKLSSAVLRRMIAVSLLTVHIVSSLPAKNREQRRASADRFPHFLSLTPSPCAQLTPQGTNILIKVTVNRTGINRSIPEDEWKNIQAPFMRPDWSIMHGLRRGEWLKIGGCPFPSDYSSWFSCLRNQEEGNP
ncbi:helix-turn-helix domain-containing protein [Anaeromassilibacillus sp. An200]|uniref:helix-turn-helix domain-containing protein n=1 Tax=Anaeromassilibacillus sp. An200 TaxID=1965587 RepID=UPI000B37D858|nr:helix-turn-helix domain-containing protein [Anaeromassilibacillus sp. An200]OUP06577.1 hypothetical protein B5F35_15305 [Anaeromassilibacillus sp. An200]